MFDALFEALSSLISFYYDLVPSFAFAIVMLTLTVVLLTLPLTWKGTRSMLQMQKMQPELKKLQEKYRNDRVKLNEELMAFYKEQGVNPLGGCLPMLLPMPVLFVMYNVISGLTHTPLPKYISQDSKLFDALTNVVDGAARSTGKMMSLGVDLAKSATDSAPLTTRLALFTLVGLSIGSQYLQTKRMNGRSTAQSQMNSQMVIMQRVMPIFMGAISINLPGGVVLYFVTSNIVRILQQEAMYKFDPHLKAHAADARVKNAEHRAIRAKEREQSKAEKAKQAQKEQAQREQIRRAQERKAQAGVNGNGKGKDKPTTGRVTTPGGGIAPRPAKKKSGKKRGR